MRSIISEVVDDAELDQREVHDLTRACEIEDQLAALREAVADEGVTIPGSRGQSIIHPALSELRQLSLVQFKLLHAVRFEAPEDRPKPQQHARLSRQARNSAIRQKIAEGQ